MHRGSTGTYKTIQVHGQTVRAFVPYALPPDPPIQMSSQLQRVADEALLACGRLDAVTRLLPDHDLFLYTYVRQEAVLSSQIEGTQSSLSDLLMFELDISPGVPISDVVEVSNYVAALQHGITRLSEGFPLSSRLIREIHEVLMASGRGAHSQPGVFRQSQNWIGGTRPETAMFVPPPPMDVPDAMGALERFLHDHDYGPLLMAGIAHVQFETIHPFLDGNGRTGRLLIALILHAEGVLSKPLLYLSLYLKLHRTEYYRLLDNVRQHGDWESWLLFYLEGVSTTATGAVQTALRITELFARDMASLHDIGRGRTSAERVLRVAQTRPLLTIDLAANICGMSFPTASSAILRLLERGILSEITGKQRNRLFAYKEYLSLLQL